jgi:hypothetical protein
MKYCGRCYLFDSIYVTKDKQIRHVKRLVAPRRRSETMPGQACSNRAKERILAIRVYPIQKFTHLFIIRVIN